MQAGGASGWWRWWSWGRVEGGRAHLLEVLQRALARVAILRVGGARRDGHGALDGAARGAGRGAVEEALLEEVADE
eukprot:1692755-Prymnesium_polylepis.1